MQKSIVILMVLSLVVFASPVLAVQEQTWVSGTGSDSNNGSITAPFASFQRAVTGTIAGGVITVEGPGNFGDVTIDRSITIDGRGFASTITTLSGSAITVSAGDGDTVILKNLNLSGLNSGDSPTAVTVNSGSEVRLDDCSIEGFTFDITDQDSTSPSILTILNTKFQDGIYGVSITAPQSVVSLDNCCIINPVTWGVFASTSGNLTVKNTTITGGEYGVWVGGGVSYYASLTNDTITNTSSAGFLVGATDTGDITSSVVSKNTGDAINAVQGGVINADTDTFSRNGTAVESDSGSRIRLISDRLFDNTVGIASTPGTVSTNGSNTFAGNLTRGTTTTSVVVQ